MTPEEARRLLDGTTPGPWYCRDDAGLLAVDSGAGPVAIDVHEADTALVSAAPDMARTIAGMTTEHRHEVQSIADGTWHPLTEWAEGEPDRRPWNVTPTRIVRRYVTTPEEA